MNKKEEEKKEEIKQKRKIEFLIRQSGIYAEFMANKLGLQKINTKQNEVCRLTKEEKIHAKNNVRSIIKEIHQKRNEFEN